MGASRSAPDPKFEENLKAATEQPEGRGRTTSLLNALTSGSNIMGRTGRATIVDTPGGYSGLGASGGTEYKMHYLESLDHLLQLQ